VQDRDAKLETMRSMAAKIEDDVFNKCETDKDYYAALAKKIIRLKEMGASKSLCHDFIVT
jgi:hypothetical protein